MTNRPRPLCSELVLHKKMLADSVLNNLFLNTIVVVSPLTLLIYRIVKHFYVCFRGHTFFLKRDSPTRLFKRAAECKLVKLSFKLPLVPSLK